MTANRTSINIRDMFSNISNRYDLMNSIMTFGRDQAWRRYLLEQVQSPSNEFLLDLGTGTGKIAVEAKTRYPDLRIVAVDFTLEMMRMGKSKSFLPGILWCNADALQLPFPDALFDAVVSGYLMRNVTDVENMFKEEFRVLKPGGCIACLDTCPPDAYILRPIVLAYIKWIIPLLGFIITGNRKAYEYLPASIRAFKSPEDLAKMMKNTGFVAVSFRYFMFRTMSVLIGTKP